MTEADCMRRAIELAHYAVASGEGGPFGAVVVRPAADGEPPEIFAEGHNRVVASNDPTAHAEVVAIRRACERAESFRLDGFELFTSCEPCPMCWSAALWARVARIVFAGSRKDAAQAGFDDSLFHAELARPLELRSLPSQQLLREEARAAFAAWGAKPDRTPY